MIPTDSLLMESRVLAVAQQFFPHQSGWILKPYGRGLIHQTWQAVSEQGFAYILQSINSQVFQQPIQVMNNLVEVVQHLQQSDYGLQIVEPLSDPHGNLLALEDQKNYWRAFPFLSNTQSLEQITHSEQAYTAAKAFGHFAKCLANLPNQKIKASIPNFHNCNFRQQQLQEAIKKDRVGRHQYVKKEIAFLKQYSFCKEWQDGSFPIRLSHNDTKLNNLLFDLAGVQPVAVIDLDTVMPASPLFDFGDMVRTFTPNVSEDSVEKNLEINMDYYRALKEGYLEMVKDWLSPTELEALPLAALLITQVQAQRFLTDYLNGDVYYKVQNPEQNLIRTRNQIALLKAMLHQKKQM